MKIETRRLKNGLHVFLAHMPGTKTVCAVFVVRAGWRYERWGADVGVAHFLEHENFRGTPRRPTSKDISSAIEGVGGESNAVTDPDIISYYDYVPVRHAELGIDVLSDIVSNPLLEEEGINIERGLVKEEYKEVLSRPEWLLSDIYLPRLVFGDNPLGWVGTGNEQEIDRIDRDLMLSYMNDLFTGPNSAVVCAGNIPDSNRLFEVIKDCFNGLPAYPPRRRKKHYKDDQVDIRMQLVEKDIEQALLGITFKYVPIRSRYALGILETILGRGMSSRLFINVRVSLGLSYNIYSSLDIYSDIATLSIFGRFDSRKWKKGLEAIMGELRSIREEGVDEEELNLAKEKMCGDIEFILERPDKVALGLAESWSLFGKVRNLDLIEKSIRSVEADEVALVASELFRASKINCVVLGASLNEEEEARAILSSLGGD